MDIRWTHNPDYGDSNSVVLMKNQLDGDRRSIDHPLNISSQSAPWWYLHRPFAVSTCLSKPEHCPRIIQSWHSVGSGV